MTRRVLGFVAVAVLAVAALTAVVLCLPLLLPALVVEQFRRRPSPSAACRCEDCADIADEFADIADRNPDLAGYGRKLPDLYLIPSMEES